MPTCIGVKHLLYDFIGFNVHKVYLSVLEKKQTRNPNVRDNDIEYVRMQQVHVLAVGRVCSTILVEINSQYKLLELVSRVWTKLAAKRHAVFELRDVLEIKHMSTCCHALEIPKSPEAVEGVEEVWVVRVNVHGGFHLATGHDVIIRCDDHRVCLASGNTCDLDACSDASALQVNLPK